MRTFLLLFHMGNVLWVTCHVPSRKDIGGGDRDVGFDWAKCDGARSVMASDIMIDLSVALRCAMDRSRGSKGTEYG